MLFQCDNGWARVFTELNKKQHEDACDIKRIVNPGWCPTGFIILMCPLVDGSVLKEGTKINGNAISGHSGSGNGQMNIFEDKYAKNEPWYACGFELKHKHMHRHLKCQNIPALMLNPIFNHKLQFSLKAW